jgi:hypothetical protein
MGPTCTHTSIIDSNYCIRHEWDPHTRTPPTPATVGWSTYARTSTPPPQAPSATARMRVWGPMTEYEAALEPRFLSSPIPQLVSDVRLN